MRLKCWFSEGGHGDALTTMAEAEQVLWVFSYWERSQCALSDETGMKTRKSLSFLPRIFRASSSVGNLLLMQRVPGLQQVAGKVPGPIHRF